MGIKKYIMDIMLKKIQFQMFFEDNIDDAKYCGHLYGLGTSFVVNGSGGYLDSNGDNSSSS